MASPTRWGEKLSTLCLHWAVACPHSHIAVLQFSAGWTIWPNTQQFMWHLRPVPAFASNLIPRSQVNCDASCSLLNASCGGAGSFFHMFHKALHAHSMYVYVRAPYLETGFLYHSCCRPLLHLTMEFVARKFVMFVFAFSLDVTPEDCLAVIYADCG